MSGIRIVNERNPERKRAGSYAAANMLLWAGLLVLIWGILAKFSVVAIVVGAALCLLARHQNEEGREEGLSRLRRCNRVGSDHLCRLHEGRALAGSCQERLFPSAPAVL